MHVGAYEVCTLHDLCALDTLAEKYHFPIDFTSSTCSIRFTTFDGNTLVPYLVGILYL